MPDREAILRTIDEGYARRAAGDKAGVAAVLAPDATFRVAGDLSEMPWAPSYDRGAMPAIETLMDNFHFHAIERIGEIVEADKAAIHWRVTLSYNGGPQATTELYDFWTVRPDGKLGSLVQFADTALIARLSGFALAPAK